MRVARAFIPLSPRIRMVAGVVLITAFLWGIAEAVQRRSPGYAIWIDSLNGGGGAAASASYRQADSAVGQESDCGPAASSGYRNQAGVVLEWAVPPAEVEDWKHYR